MQQITIIDQKSKVEVIKNTKWQMVFFPSENVRIKIIHYLNLTSILFVNLKIKLHS